MKTIKITVELMTNDREDTIIGIAGYSPEAINPDLLEKIMRKVKGMGERLSKGYEEKSSCSCSCGCCDCEEDEEELIEEEDEDICPNCLSHMDICPIGNYHTAVVCPNCDYMEVID